MKEDYEEFHETRQSILQSETEPLICGIGNKERDCRWLYKSTSKEDWGWETSFECLHPGWDDEKGCPLDKEDG